MAISITVPRLGWTMEEGVFVGWLKRDGDEVRPGDMVFELEGEKASQEIESLDGGILRIPPDAPKPGDVVKVGALLGYLAAPDEATPWSQPEPAAVPAGAAAGGGHEPARTAVPAGRLSADAAVAPGHFATDVSGRSRTDAPARLPTISPRAWRVAAELGVDWTGLEGTGRTGRIRERDVRATGGTARRTEQPTVATPPPATRRPQPELRGRLIPLTPARRAIAQRMAAGAHQAAPVTLTTKADATNLVSLRAQFKAADAAAGPAPSYTDIILKLTAITLREHPMLNAQWRDDGLFIADEIHIAIAVDTRSGLVAPVVRNPDRLSLRQLAAESAALIDRAVSHKLSAAQLEGGTFTVSNLGMFGIDAFTPILNLPQCAILGIGRIQREPAVVGDQIVPRDLLTFSLTFDHRVIDGAPAAHFLDCLRKTIENPAPLLVS